MTILKKIGAFAKFVRIEHTIFALPFFILTLAIIKYTNKHSFQLNLSKLLYLVVAFISARALGMALNRIIDYHIDFRNPRTANRPLQKRELSIREAFIFAITTTIIFVFCTYSINYSVFKLSPIVVVVMLIYPYTKRFTYFCHFVLGFIHFMLPMAISFSLLEEIYLPLFYLSFGIMFLIAGSDILYSIADIEFDKKEKLYSLPVRIGVKNSIIAIVITYIISSLFFTAFFLNLSNFRLRYSIFAVILSFIISSMLVLKIRKQIIRYAGDVFFINNCMVGILLTAGALLDCYRF
jgi:4-hydroxybenzoate polyprenyltransferase